MTVILFGILRETLLALIAKIAWRQVSERFLSRLIVYALGKLRDYSTNEVVDATITDVINSLSGKGLEVIDQITPAQTAATATGGSNGDSTNQNQK